MTKTLADIAAQLEQPFPIAEIDLLPKGQIERDGRVMCMALPFADKRVYEDRLNELCPGEWSTPAPTIMVAGQKLIVSVTVVICGVPHSDIGEAPATGENAGTEAFAQGFKRACSQAGLGRFLYSLEKQWVPYDKQRKQIALDATGIQNIVRTMYNKARIGVVAPPSTPAVQEQVPAPEPRPASTDHRITPNQLRSLKNLSKCLGRELVDIETLSQQSASETIAELGKQWREVQFKQNQQQQQKAS